MATISITTLIIFSMIIFLSNSPAIHSTNSLEKTHQNPMIIKMKANTPINNNNLIENTCKITPNYNLCISTLESNPRIADITDVAGLGLVIVDALKTKAILAMEVINKLKMSNPEYNLPLFECSILYNAILKADVPVAIEGLILGDPKFAEAAMDDAALEVGLCEQSFQEFTNSIISDMNKGVFDLSVVAKSIIRLLL